MTNKKKISHGFNLILFIYFCVDFLVSLLFDPNIDEKVPWDVVYKAFPVLSVIVAFVLGLTLLLLGAKLFEAFWNRLISDVFGLRELNFQETIAIILVLAIVGI